MKHIVLILSCCLPAYAPLLLGLVRQLCASWMRATHGARDKGHSTVTMDEVLVPRAYINTKRAVWANSFRVVQTIMGRPAKGQKPWLQKHSTKRVHVRRVCWTKNKKKYKKMKRNTQNALLLECSNVFHMKMNVYYLVCRDGGNEKQQRLAMPSMARV